MANSIKETKVLFEGFRRFAIKEAETSGGEVIKIYDFDGTLFKPTDAFEEVAGPANFYLPYFNEAVLARVNAKAVANSKPMPIFASIKKESEGGFDNIYISSLVGSGGFNKPKSYFVDLLVNGDEKFKAILTKIFGMKGATLAKVSGDAEAELEVDDETGEAFYTKGPVDRKAAEKIVEKYLIFDKGEAPEPDNERRENIKKAAIKAVLAKNGVSQFPEDHIYVSSNVAESTSGTTGEIVAGSSGKYKAAKEIAAKHPNAAGFEVYDNSSINLVSIKDGIVAQRKPAGENQKQERSSPAVDEELGIKSFKVVDGEPVVSTGETRSKSAVAAGKETKDVLTRYFSLRSQIFSKILQKRKLKMGGNKQKFLEILKKSIPADIQGVALATINDVIENPSSDQRGYVKGLMGIFSGDQLEAPPVSREESEKKKPVDPAKAPEALLKIDNVFL
jgi:hypothetical protein